ncbi:MAG: DUF6314 family protein [Kiloniellales bacterium]
MTLADESLPGVADLRAFLAGGWKLRRTIDDRRAGQRGTLEGAAVFTPEGDGLVYREAGVLDLAGYRGSVIQAYRYSFPAPHRAEVAFRDGGLFHVLDLSARTWAAEHVCAGDLYRGDFLVEGPDQWRVSWTVTGPRKDQTLISRYSRSG